MRLWAWEENNYKQNQKRKALWTAAVICWAAALCVTYWVEHSLYGGVVETKTLTYFSVSIGLPIGLWLRKVMGKEEKPMTKGGKWINGILVAIIVGYVVYRRLVVYVAQQVFVFLPLFWSEHEKKKDIDRISLYACTLFLAAVMLAAGTVAGGRLTGNETTGRAEKTLQAEGFTEVEYVRWMYGRWVYQDAVEKDFYEESMEREKYYLFSGKKDGEAWRMVIDPKGGEIILAATNGEEPELANWI